MQDRAVTVWSDTLNAPRSCAEKTVSSEVYDEHYYLEQDGPGGWRSFLEIGGQHLYYLAYGVFPFNLIFDDIIYALAWPDKSRI